MPPDCKPDRPFDEPWQARAFALTVALHEGGAFEWSEWATTLGETIVKNAERPYWLAWLEALEQLTIAKGLAEAAAIVATARAWREAADRTPHGELILLERSDGPAPGG